jgi:hypothetical protein
LISRTYKIAFKAAVLVVLAVCVTAVAVFCLSAGNSLAKASSAPSSDSKVSDSIKFGDAEGTAEASILESSDVRDVSAAYEQIDAEEKAAAEQAAAAARASEQEAIERAAAAKSKAAAAGCDGVWDVDFSVGREAFVAEWTDRINKYLAGSPLAGYGETFAVAAWENGVDPRWSPAISNTESTKGRNCFMPHNAWGWTGGSWSNWTSAINAHVYGLASIYGYTISYANAVKYCPPNCDNWYRDTLNEMQKI